MPTGVYIRKIPVWNKGKKLGFTPKGAFKKGQIPWNKGKHGIYSKEIREKIRLGRAKQVFTVETRMKLSKSHQGSRSYLWRGGITKENHRIRNTIEYRLWREAVFARDHWNCQNCGGKGYMHAHHIKSFSEYPGLRFAIDNGITLCRKCHKKLHTGAEAEATLKPKETNGGK